MSEDPCHHGEAGTDTPCPLCDSDSPVVPVDAEGTRADTEAPGPDRQPASLGIERPDLRAGLVLAPDRDPKLWLEETDDPEGAWIAGDPVIVPR